MNEIVEEKAVILQRDVAPVMDRLSALEVIDAASFDVAGQACKDLTALEKRIQEYWEPEVKRAHEMHRSLVKKRDEMLKPVSEKKAILRGQMTSWADEQERVRREAQRLAEENARRIAEEQALAEAEAHERAGDAEAASAVLDQPLAPPPVIMRSQVPKGYGQFTRKVWRAEVTDLMALVKAVAAGKAPLTCLEANMPFLNNQARALNSALNYPGVRAVQ